MPLWCIALQSIMFEKPSPHMPAPDMCLMEALLCNMRRASTEMQLSLWCGAEGLRIDAQADAGSSSASATIDLERACVKDSSP